MLLASQESIQTPSQGVQKHLHHNTVSKNIPFTGCQKTSPSQWGVQKQSQHNRASKNSHITIGCPKISPFQQEVQKRSQPHHNRVSKNNVPITTGCPITSPITTGCPITSPSLHRVSKNIPITTGCPKKVTSLSQDVQKSPSQGVQKLSQAPSQGVHKNRRPLHTLCDREDLLTVSIYQLFQRYLPLSPIHIFVGTIQSPSELITQTGRLIVLIFIRT
uniref:Uncharacterized protein n=1 Tax=Cacopsylla melanoneura TaxID=428564 RepID=A0A8D8SX24_9HEMI